MRRLCCIEVDFASNNLVFYAPFILSQLSIGELLWPSIKYSCLNIGNLGNRKMKKQNVTLNFWREKEKVLGLAKLASMNFC